MFLYTNIFFAPDEHYFINACEKYKIKYVNKILTFVNWNYKRFNGRPLTYFSLNNDNINEIKKTDALFMRKVPEQCNLPSYFDDIS